MQQANQESVYFQGQSLAKTPNFITLSISSNKIYANLHDFSTQLQSMQKTQIKAVLYEFPENIKWDESQIRSSSTGKFVSVLNYAKGYFKIFSVDNSQLLKQQKLSGLDEDIILSKLHMLSVLTPIMTGVAVSLEWNSYEDQFCILQCMDSTNQPVAFKENFQQTTKKKGLFSSKIIKFRSYIFTKDV